MITSCKSNSLLPHFSPWDNMSSDTSGILGICTKVVVILIYDGDSYRISLRITDDVDEDCNMFSGWISEFIIHFSIKVCDHESERTRWEKALRKLRKFFKSEIFFPVLCREHRHARYYLRKCGTLPSIDRPERSLRELRISEISCIWYGSEIGWMYEHIEVFIIDGRTASDEDTPLRDETIFPVGIRNARWKREDMSKGRLEHERIIYAREESLLREKEEFIT